MKCVKIIAVNVSLKEAGINYNALRNAGIYTVDDLIEIEDLTSIFGNVD